jgi:hypothetical protein
MGIRCAAILEPVTAVAHPKFRSGHRRLTNGFLIRGHDLGCVPLTCASVSTAARFVPLVCSVWAPLSEDCRPRSNIIRRSSMFGPCRPLRRVIAPGSTAVGPWRAALASPPGGRTVGHPVVTRIPNASLDAEPQRVTQCRPMNLRRQARRDLV